MMRWSRQLIVAICLAGVLLPSYAMANANPTMSSTSYNVVESEVGGTGCNSASQSLANYCGASTSYSFNPATGTDGGSTLGESAVGNSSSASYQTGAGYNTFSLPGLTLVVNSASVSLGTLTSTAGSWTNATFDVTDRTSYGYVVQVVGSAPNNGEGHSLTTLATDTASQAGTEQFGMNMVYNGVDDPGGSANPQQVPSSVFSFGVAGDGTHNYYTQANKYRYNSGETIASSPETSGDTHYTMTFLANISPLTPAGKYTGALDIVATGTY